MRPNAGLVLAAFALAALGGPLALGLAGALRRGARAGRAPGRSPAWDWRLSVASALLYALAFDLVFLVQELFLVVPKALTPGLRPTLYHNNHGWTGDHPLARLFQGTGALAILVVALLAVWWLRRRPAASSTARLFAVWVAFQGVFQSLPQLVAGAVLPQNDVGMAMDYLRWGPAAMLAGALAATAAMAVAGSWLARPVLALADDPARTAGPAERARFVLRAATLPALGAVPLVVLSRVPGSVDQVALVPVVVTVLGVAWMQANAWRATPTAPPGPRRPPALRGPLAALAVVLLVFHLVLRHGVAF